MVYKKIWYYQFTKIINTFYKIKRRETELIILVNNSDINKIDIDLNRYLVFIILYVIHSLKIFWILDQGNLYIGNNINGK